MARLECWGAELFDSDEPRTLDQFATEAVPVDVSSASNSGDAVAAAGEVTGDHGGGVVGGVEAPGEAGAAARGALGLHVRASSAGPTPPAAGEVVPWPLVTWPPEAPASLCESALVPGGPLESLVDPRIVDGWIGLPAARFVPGVAVELETAFLRPNSTVRLSVVGGPVPRAGEPVGDFGALVPVEFPPATADPQGELSLAWTVPEAPAGRVGPMWYLVRGPGVAQLTHHTLDVRLTHPIIAYPDVAPCAVDDEATTTAATSVRVDVVANDIAPTGGTLDPASGDHRPPQGRRVRRPPRRVGDLHPRGGLHRHCTGALRGVRHVEHRCPRRRDRHREQALTVRWVGQFHRSVHNVGGMAREATGGKPQARLRAASVSYGAPMVRAGTP